MTVAPFNPDRLAPEVRDLLRSVANTNQPPMETLTMAEMRKAYRQVGRAFGGEPLPVAQIRDLEVDGPLGSIPLRLYRGLGAEEAAPATVFLHGGGWSTGDLDTHDKVCRRLVHVTGHPVVSVAYRLAPEHPAPAGPEDVLAAIRALVKDAEKLGLDPNRLAIAGDSAGGSLAAVACQQLRGGPIALRAQVLFYPSTDLSPASWHYASRQENGAVPPLTLGLMHAMSDPYVAGFNAMDPRVSPLRAEDFHNLPPALIFAGECDALRDDARLYQAALKTAGVEVEYVELHGMVHGFIEMAGVLQAAVQAFERAGTFLREHLA
ncbi:Alpha/beta hydrolase fold-3 domain protein [Komagataeibacter xylinus E25]|nr:Alpha/beta hydrolase fold-3 domain protein [Komagataeibacter xylinus E25]